MATFAVPDAPQSWYSVQGDPDDGSLDRADYSRRTVRLKGLWSEIGQVGLPAAEMSIKTEGAVGVADLSES